MKALTKVGLAGLAVVAMTLSACGTDDNTDSSSGSDPTAVSPAAAQGSADGASGPADDSGAADSASGPTDAFAAAGFACADGTLRSSGSTAQGKVMAQLINDYNERCGAEINAYGGGGSGKGVSDFIAGQTDFSGSDSPMDADELTQAREERCEVADAINLPMVTGPIALAYHLTGVDTLVLTPDLLSDVFAGRITTWNDEKIAAANPDVDLPAMTITTVHRSEDSGTTDNFTTYLAAAGNWDFPGGKAWSAPGGTGAQGSDGVAKAVRSTEGSLGYVEWGYAQQFDLAMAEIDNGAGPVALTAESAGAMVETARIVGTGKDLTLEIDYATSSPGAYPIILVTYELVCSGGNGETADLLRSFLGYAATAGQQDFERLGAAPLPDGIRAKVVSAIQDLG